MFFELKLFVSPDSNCVRHVNYAAFFGHTLCSAHSSYVQDLDAKCVFMVKSQRNGQMLATESQRAAISERRIIDK